LSPHPSTRVPHCPHHSTSDVQWKLNETDAQVKIMAF
jgi:hypothetical protein